MGLATALVLAGCGGDGGSMTDAGLTGAVHDPYPVSDVVLQDTDGRDYSLVEDTDKGLTLVFFGYTRCPDICPMVMGSLASALTRLDERDREQVEVVFITTDPARDTPEELRAYLDRFDPSFIGLTGELPDIIAAGEPLKVYVDDGEELPSGGYDLGSHSTQVSAIYPDDTSPILWTQDTSSAQFASDIHQLLSAD